jgi:hypothetical protein
LPSFNTRRKTNAAIALARKTLETMGTLSEDFIETITTPTGVQRFLSLVNSHRLRQVLNVMLDENEFLSPYGVRSLSRFHRILFFEYFHGDNGAGLGASHQTAWAGLVAKLTQQGYTEHGRKQTGTLDPKLMEEAPDLLRH